MLVTVGCRHLRFLPIKFAAANFCNDDVVSVVSGKKSANFIADVKLNGCYLQSKKNQVN